MKILLEKEDLKDNHKICMRKRKKERIYDVFSTYAIVSNIQGSDRGYLKKLNNVK